MIDPHIKRFEVYLVNLDPTIGHEIKKSRPCLIISPDEMNFLKTIIIAPMTTVKRDFPFRLNIRFAKKNGQIAFDQIRSIDRKRLTKKLGGLNEKYFPSASRILIRMFSI